MAISFRRDPGMDGTLTLATRVRCAMRILEGKTEDAVTKGLARQIVVADAEGFVLDNRGSLYDPDQLVSVFMSTERHMEDGAKRLAFGPIVECDFRLTGTDVTIGCRRVFTPDRGCLVIVVVPMGVSYGLIISDVIRRFIKYVEEQRSVLGT